MLVVGMKIVYGLIEGISSSAFEDVIDRFRHRFGGRVMDANVIARRGLRLVVGRGQEGVEGFFHIPPTFCA
jgi:hypothetical protein